MRLFLEESGDPLRGEPFLSISVSIDRIWDTTEKMRPTGLKSTALAFHGGSDEHAS